MGTSWNRELVANPVDGRDELELLRLTEAAPQAPNVHVDGPLAAVEVFRPGKFEKLQARQDLASVTREHVEQIELPRFQRDFTPAVDDQTTRTVDHQPADANSR